MRDRRYHKASICASHDDAVGSLRLETNMTGGVNCRADYYPFGESVGSGCTGYDDFRFAGLFSDAGYEDGGYSATRRRYSDTYYRWFSPDPGGRKVVKLNDPQTWNMYAYAGNNPISHNDPSGLSWLWYNGESHTLIVVTSRGEVYGKFPAYNNVAIHNRQGQLTSGPIANGFYPIRSKDANGAWQHLGGSVNSSWGKNGVIQLLPYTGIRGNNVQYGEIHPGRANKGGPVALTEGCTRTTECAMQAINTLAKKDPLTGFLVTGNQENIDKWAKKAGVSVTGPIPLCGVLNGCSDSYNGLNLGIHQSGPHF